MCKPGPESDARMEPGLDWTHFKPTSTLTSDMCIVFTHSVVKSFSSRIVLLLTSPRPILSPSPSQIQKMETELGLLTVKKS